MITVRPAERFDSRQSSAFPLAGLRELEVVCEEGSRFAADRRD